MHVYTWIMGVETIKRQAMAVYGCSSLVKVIGSVGAGLAYGL